MTQTIRWWIFLILGFYLCSVLTIIPLAMNYQWFRPQWLLMFVIFCQIVNPKSFHPALAWGIGLLLDSLLGSRLGEQAIVFAVIGYITAILQPRFMLRPLWRQVGKIFLLVCLGQILTLWFHAFAGQNPHTLLYWAGTLTSCIVWPGLVIVLHGLCHILSVVRFPSRSI